MMAAADLVPLLVETTLASSVAVLLVLLVRRPLRGTFGAGMAYAAWALVPAMLLVLAIPGPSLPLVVSMPQPAVATAQTAVASMPQPAQQWPNWLVTAWIAGVVVMLSWMAWQQYRFQHAMGGLHRRADGAWQSSANAGLPAVVGMLPSRIVLPRDFEQRYDARQRSLMLAHERVHLARGDVRWNALAMLLRSLFWFNPLLHVGHACFRRDQELACDQRVIARHPDARHAYGEAMLKTQLATQSLPLGCHWRHGHPLKERLEMLKQPVPTLKRLLAGSLLVTALVSGGAYAAWATQMPAAGENQASSQAPDFTAEIGLTFDDEATQDFRIANRFGTPFSVRNENASGDFEIEATVAPTQHQGAQAYRIDARISRNGQLQAEPSLVVRANKSATISQGTRSAEGKFRGVALTMRVLPAADSAPADVKPARLTTSSRANGWSSYEQLVGSLSASWEKPAAPPGDDC